MKTERGTGHGDDALLARIAEHVRIDQKDDARFERVAQNVADDAELAELARMAEADPELASRVEASRPFGEEVVDRIAQRAASALRKSAPAEKAPAKVVQISSWRRRLAVAAGPIALAAGIVLYIAAGPKLGADGSDLPAYSVTASGQAAMRGPSEPSTRLHVAAGKDARFEVVLRPATAPTVKVVAYAFTISPGAEPSPLDAKIEIASEGSVRITGPAKTLDDAREIRLVVGAPEAIGKFDDALARAKSGSSDRHVRVIPVAVDRD